MMTTRAAILASGDPAAPATSEATKTGDDQTVAPALDPTPEKGEPTRQARGSASAPSLNRRRLLRGVLGAAAATVAAGAALQTQTSGVEAASGTFTASGLEASAVSATGTNAAYGVNAFSDTEIAVFGHSNSGMGVDGTSQGGVGVNGASTRGGIGVSGNSDSGYAVWGHSTSGTGVYGETGSTAPSATAIKGVVTSTVPGSFSAAVAGQNNGTGSLGIGVSGTQNGSGWGVYGTSVSGWGVYGAAGNTGVRGYSSGGTGVAGQTDSTASRATAIMGLVSSTTPGSYSAAVRGQNNGTAGLGIGVYGSHNGSGWGVYGTSVGGNGVYGLSSGGAGVAGASSTGTGVVASSTGGLGLSAQGGSAPLRLVPAAGPGAPTSGAHNMGELYVDSGGSLYFCTASGSPGTWKQVTLS